MQREVGVPWRTPTSDTFKVGDPHAPLTGITTTFMSTLAVLQQSVAAGNNFVVTHEPTFWIANDSVTPLYGDPLLKAKLDYIAEHRLTIYRFHDHWHAHRPDGIFAGWSRTMGWDAYAVAGKPLHFELPPTTLAPLAQLLASKLHVRSMRLVGSPTLPIRRVAIGGHYISQCMPLLPEVDAIIVFESREWEAAEYIRDAIALGMPKALIQLPHEGGEEAGMEECARWLQTFVHEVPIHFIPAGDPFWLAT
jgi:putative NIF3 family GTP cyclohydrolase 1 type 2